jgi:nitrite reductase/ring-hydroxylating ferredoxin subunit
MNDEHDRNFGTAPGASPVVDIGALRDLPPGSTMRASLPETGLTVANIGDRVVAVVDLCLRCSHPLSAGALRKSTLLCLHCGWQYDLERGETVGLPALKLEQRGVLIKDGRLLIECDAVSAPSAT